MRIGLCEKCRHAKIITSDRGNEFIMCELARSDTSFAKYPRLPVLNCRGYVEQPGETPSPREEADE